MGHSACEILQNITNGNAHTTDAWLAIADLWINGDDLRIVHAFQIQRYQMQDPCSMTELPTWSGGRWDMMVVMFCLS